MKASLLMLAAFLMFGASLAPACDSLCCPLAPPDAALHAAMPCCTGASTMSRPDALRFAAVTTTGQLAPPQMPAPVAAIVWPDAPAIPSRVQAGLIAGSAAHHEPSPPLFLLNAQFLI